MTDAVLVELYWRPGCGFCSRLFDGLERLGIEYEAHNIWDDPAASARVRSVARGHETVPTVFIGSWAAVNPSARDVAEALAGLSGASGR